MFVALLSLALDRVLVNDVYKLRNTAAADVVAALAPKFPGAMLTPEPISNTIFLSGPLPRFARAKAMIAAMDRATPFFLVDVRVCTGDPLGSRAAGTLKVISEPKLVTTEGKPGFIRAGGSAEIDGEQVATGPEIQVTVLGVDGERLRLRIEASFTSVEGDKPQQSIKTIKSVVTRWARQGEDIRLRIGQKSDETWVEVRAFMVESMK